MKVSTLLVPALSALATAAPVDAQKQVIISYPNETPNNVLDDAKKAIIAGGGIITHEFEIIRGFAATVAESVLNTVKTMNEQYHAEVEEDRIVSVSSS